MPGDARGVGHAGGTGHSAGVGRAGRPHLLSGVFRSRLSAGTASVSPDPAFLDRAWSVIAAAAARANVAVVLGTERVVESGLLIAVLVVDRDGTIAGFEDKVQLDPSEEGTYVSGGPLDNSRLNI